MSDRDVMRHEMARSSVDPLQTDGNMGPQHEDEHQLYLGRKVYKQGAGARQLSCVHLVWQQRIDK